MNNKYKYYKNQQGMAAIFTVLVISAASLILARSAAFLSINSLDISFVVDKGREAEYVADGCIEESIRRLQLDNDYIVTDLLVPQDNNSCRITIGRSGFEYFIDAVGIVGDYHKKITAELTINNDQTSIKKWSANN